MTILATNSIPINEREFLGQVVDLAKMFGWRVYHTWLSKHSAAGFPDLVLVRPPRLVFAELKSEKGKLTVPQAQWIWLLRQCAETYIWRPHQFEKIVEKLR